MNKRALWVALLAAACSMAGPARAHAPLPRAVAVAPDGSGAVVLRMPGFGFLLRSDRDASFAYACDALYGVSPIDENTPMAYRADGTLLVGTQNGLRVVEPSGCPRAEVRLPGVAVLALAVHGSGRIYSITQAAGAAPLVQRSDDGGATWMPGAALDAKPVTALVLDAGNADRVFVSQSALSGAVLTTSQDGGAILQRVETAEPWILLHVQASSARMWARMRLTDQPVGVRIAHAAILDGSWQSALEVNFFGGFAVDPSEPDVIFVGDEARGVFRSSDGGDSFEETQPDVSSACLTYGDGALWSCTPGLPHQTALARSSDALTPFVPVMAFDDARRLVACEDVEELCASAWVEWQRDVLGVSLASDAGIVGAPDARSPEAGPPFDGGDAAPIVPPRDRGPSCTLAPTRASARAGALTPLWAALLIASRRRRLHKSLI
jgi:hypothetical protein